MSVPNSFYQIIKNNDSSSLVTICRNEPCSFSILSRYEEEVKDVFSSHSDLLNGDKSISLFETESIFDHLDDKWLYNEDEWSQYKTIMNMSGEDITTLMVDYIREDIVPSWLEVCRWFSPEEMRNMFSIESCSDVEILDTLMFLSFDNITGERARVSLQRIDGMANLGNGRAPSEYNFNKGVDWKAIITATRERYSLAREEDKAISWAISCGINSFVNSLAPHDEKMVSGIKSLASATSSSKAYKTAVKQFMEENNLSLLSNGGGCGSIGEGYSTDYTCGFSNGGFTIKIQNIVLAYKDEENYDMQDMSTKLQTFEEDTLWTAVYNQYSTNLFS
jgi:hypothetical protein